MNRKDILMSSVIIALAATMLFATIATPALAEKKDKPTVVSFSYPIPSVTPCGGDMIVIDGKMITRKVDSNTESVKLILKISFYDDGKKIGNSHSITLDNIYPNEVPYTSVSKVTSTCNGGGVFTNNLLVTVNDDPKVDFGFD